MSYTMTPFTGSGTAILPPRHVMSVNQFLQSPNKRYRLIFQEDQNLVMYDGDKAAWVADASSAYAGQMTYKWKAVERPEVFMNYGLVVNDFLRQRIWQTTNTIPPGGDKYFDIAAQRSYLQLQDDGNLVIIDSTVFWASNSAIPVTPDQPAIIIPAGTTLEVDKRYVSGGTTLIFQSDGNLVVSNGPLGVLWASWTQNKGATRAVMQTDGNFVIYNASNVPLWQTGTAGQPNAYARIQTNGSFSIAAELPAWARFGYTPTLKPVRFLIEYGPYTVFSYKW
ncbi:putidacin L1 family lectin-like bacteriocin [Pseudomonas sp. 681]|uniref:Putidacin L1 family lectin-like bacteriocin n=1 Tax=Pseudomonas fungipugnans TaxID=3024217 RepID=A0ABT6QGU5_9PSED|nr:putidacin L1 family lectin-like bacteriocin [Pseudomonas sp. 681]MDI2590010.1 putidacin L1 family lectin-like bacteriocin [Pseudomonas sp. 681]